MKGVLQSLGDHKDGKDGKLPSVFTSKASSILRWIILYIPNKEKKNITTMPFIVGHIPNEDKLKCEKNVQLRIYAPITLFSDLIL